jgi:hypothetical protein
LLGEAVSAAYGPSLHSVQGVFAVLGVPAEPALVERLEFVVSGVLCGADTAVACGAS